MSTASAVTDGGNIHQRAGRILARAQTPLALLPADKPVTGRGYSREGIAEGYPVDFQNTGLACLAVMHAGTGPYKPACWHDLRNAATLDQQHQKI